MPLPSPLSLSLSIVIPFSIINSSCPISRNYHEKARKLFVEWKRASFDRWWIARGVGKLRNFYHSLQLGSRKKLSCSLIENRTILPRIPIDFTAKNSFRKMVGDRNFRFKGLFGFSISSSTINYSYSSRLNTSISIHFNAFECGWKNRPWYRISILFRHMYIYIYRTINDRKKVYVYISMYIRLYRTRLHKWKIECPKIFFLKKIHDVYVFIRILRFR